MLRFESLILNNFGPYKGYQEVVFPKERGVVIVVGANMRGKTSFLNAIRFALFGATLNRAGKSHRLIDLINDDAKSEGNFDMRVVLEFLYRGATYKITRHVSLKASGKPPTTDGDLKIDLHLSRDGTHLPQAESERELRRILPPELARFFLFDGELLQQYEELLSQADSVAQAEIIEAIEKILAVPVLLNARRHLEKLETMAQKDLESALSRDKRYEKLAEESRKLGIQVDDLNRDILQHQTLHDALNARIRELQGVIEESADLLEAVRDQQKYSEQLEKVKDEVRRERARLSSSLPATWKDVISPVLVERESALQGRKDAVAMTLGALQEKRHRASVIRQAMENKECPTCGQPMAISHDVGALETELATLEVDAGDIEVLNVEMAAISRQLTTIRGVRSQGELKRAVEAQVALDGLQVEASDIERRLARAAQRVEGRDGSEATQAQRQLQDALEARGVAKDGLAQLKHDLVNARQDLQKVKNKVPNEGHSEQVDLARAKNQIADHLRQLFSASIDVFRDALRQQVEQKSSDMFLALTSEPDYSGLRINDNYGLEILRGDGTPVAIRSAGAEHIVAYSLISALQLSSPRPGPVIVDSPFGRLDKVHSRNVVASLPKFSDQVVLLVHENELDLDATRGLLGAMLLKEYRLERRSSSHTAIVEA